jgi:hypothetical protein
VVGDKVAIAVVDTLSISGTNYYADGGGVQSDLCGFGFDIAKGQVLEATVISLAEDVTASCTSAIASIASFGGWTWTNTGEQPVASQDILSGGYTASNGLCEGYVQMGIILTGQGNPFASVGADASPHVEMGRSYLETLVDSGCPAQCNDNFGVVMQKQ